VNAEDVSRAVDLFEQYDDQRLPARDCLHAAVMLGRGLSFILSTDSHFDAVAGLTRVDPMTLFWGARAGRLGNESPIRPKAESRRGLLRVESERVPFCI